MSALLSRIPRWFWWALGLAVFVAVASPWVTSSNSDKRPRAPADWRDYTAAVASGAFKVDLLLDARLEAGQSITLSSALPSNSANIIELAPDGSYLEAGDLIAKFDRRPIEDRLRKITGEIRDLETQLEQQRADLELMLKEGEEKQAQLAYRIEVAKKTHEQKVRIELPAQYARMERDLHKIEADMRRAKENLETRQALYERGMTSSKELEQVRASWVQADLGYNMAKQEFDGFVDVTLPAEKHHAALGIANSERELSTYRVTEQKRVQKQKGSIQRSENKLLKLNEQVEEARYHLTLIEVRAPVTGILLHRKVSAGIEKRKPQVGDSLWNRAAFAVIPDMSSMIANAAVSEREVGALAVGQPVAVVPDAFPGLRIEGSVASVGSLIASPDGGAQFEVRIQLHNQDSRLRPGMSARAAVRTASLEDALRIPVEAVFVEDMKPVGFVVNGRDVSQVDLELGASNGRDVVVRAGLEAGEEVLLVYPESLQ